jgi:thiamine-phosphate pyrophosphorylase
MLKGVPFFINTLRPVEVAKAVGADGVNLEEKFSYSEARKILGSNAIIDIPVKTMDEVVAAGQMSEIDYLSVKVLPSKRTCPKNDAIWGLEGLQRVRDFSRHRVVAIGGLNLEGVAPVYEILHFDDGIALAGGLMEEDDPFATTQKIQAVRQKVRETS